MKLIRDLAAVTRPFTEAVVTLGNFDGVHLGHRAIFRRLVACARQRQGTAIVCTFDPHPLKLLAGSQAPRLINTAAEKQRLIAASQVDVLLSIPFTPEFAALPPERFVDEVLCRCLGVRHLIVGYDYAFGRGRAGSVAFLQRQGREKGFSIDVFGPVQLQGQVLSSTLVRQTLLRGDVAAAVALLGRHFNLEGRVVAGDGRGRQLGFATANLETDKELLPAAGVYAARVRLLPPDGGPQDCDAEAEYQAVVNLGWRPTFDGRQMTIEAHLLDFAGDLYGRRLRLYFIARLRDERRFADAVALQQAINGDIACARQLLEATPLVEYREYLAAPQEPA